MNRNAVLACSLAVILVLVGLWSFVFHKNSANEGSSSTQAVNDIETAPPMGAVVSFQEGTVEYSTDGVWSKSTERELSSGMSLRTVGAASRAIVKLDDSSEIRMDANTEIVFETLTINRVVIVQKSGYVYNRVTDRTARSYDVHSEHAQFQSAGTAFRTIASGDEEAVEVFQNSVKETTNNLDASEGKKLTIVNVADPDKNRTTESMDIEKLKDDPFIVWNRGLDLKNEKFKNSLGFLSDFEGPNISINSPSPGSTIELGAGSNKGSVVIKGKTEAGSTLSVVSKSVSGSDPVQVEVGSDGGFETDELAAALGTSVFEFTGKDKTGNKTVKTVSYTFKAESSSQEQGINLSYSKTTDGKLNLYWTLTGMTTPEGVKVVESETTAPVYPDNLLQDVVTGTSAAFDQSKFTNGIHYFRVCRYLSAGGGCDIYSKPITVTIPLP